MQPIGQAESQSITNADDKSTDRCPSSLVPPLGASQTTTTASGIEDDEVNITDLVDQILRNERARSDSEGK